MAWTILFHKSNADLSKLHICFKYFYSLYIFSSIYSIEQRIIVQSDIIISLKFNRRDSIFTFNQLKLFLSEVLQ